MYLSMSSPAAGSTKSHSLPPLTPARSVSLKGYRLHQPHHLPQRHTSTLKISWGLKQNIYKYERALLAVKQERK